MPLIALDLRYNNAVILMNGVPQLGFRVDQYVGFTTWATADRFCVEIVLKGGVLLAEYDTIEKLKAVLDCLLKATVS
jgi:hypothetical protein